MQKLWKMYYFVVLTLLVGGVVYAGYVALKAPSIIYTTAFQQTLFAQVLGFLALTGLHGFVFRKPILHPHLWKVVAIGYLAYEVVPLVVAPPAASLAIFASLLLSFPAILALFLYGFRSSPVWERKS